MIGQFVISELSYDQEVPQGNRKYRLTLEINHQGDIQHYATNFYPLAPALKQAIPEIKSFNRFYYLDRHAIVTIGNEKYNEMDVLFADGNFTDFFGYTDDIPTPDTPSKSGALLSEEMALKYFGSQEAVGELIKLNTEDGEHLFKVAGTFKSGELNGHLNPKIVLPSPG